jgi:hypothetical protein
MKSLKYIVGIWRGHGSPPIWKGSANKDIGSRIFHWTVAETLDANIRAHVIETIDFVKKSQENITPQHFWKFSGAAWDSRVRRVSPETVNCSEVGLICFLTERGGGGPGRQQQILRACRNPEFS